MFDVDLTQEDLDGGKTLPAPLWYPVLIKSAKKVDSTNKAGLVNLKVTYEVIENSQPDTVGTVVFDNFSLNKDSMWKMGPFLKAINPGIETGKFRGNEEALKGLTLEIFVATGEYQGRKQNNVKNYAPTGTNLKKEA